MDDNDQSNRDSGKKQSPEEKRPEWMSSISAIVNPDDYLLGRKIDKTFELSQQEKAERAKEERANLIANDKLKLSADPILELERRKEQLRLEIITNPIKLKKFRERLLGRVREEQSGRLETSQKSEPSSSIERHERAGRTDNRLLEERGSRSRRYSPSSSSSSSSTSSSSSSTSSSSSSTSSSSDDSRSHKYKRKRRKKSTHRHKSRGSPKSKHHHKRNESERRKTKDSRNHKSRHKSQEERSDRHKSYREKKRYRSRSPNRKIR